MNWTDDLIVEAMLDWAAIFGEPPSYRDWQIGWDGMYPSTKTVIKHFGSWSAAKRIAFPEPKRTKPPNYWTRERCIDALQKWASEHDGIAPSCSNRRAAGSDLPSDSTLVKVFGSRERAIRAAGLVRLPKGVTAKAVQRLLPQPRSEDEGGAR